MLTNGLSAEERDKLIARLENETISIKGEFAVLAARTEKFLEESSTTVHNLKTLFVIGDMDELADSIESTDTIPMVMRKIHQKKCWSFFNYELLKRIINAYCPTEPVAAELNVYITEFKNYCERRLCEVPDDALSIDMSDVDSKLVFSVKIDKNFTVPVSDVKLLQDRLSRLLGSKQINLTEVEDGCFKLTFRSFKKFNVVDLMDERKKIQLTSIGVRWLCCNNHTYEFHSEDLEPDLEPDFMLEKSHTSADGDKEGMYGQCS